MIWEIIQDIMTLKKDGIMKWGLNDQFLFYTHTFRIVKYTQDVHSHF